MIMEINNTLDIASRTAATNDSKRVIRPRSKVACRRCRQRKVRCDVYPNGAPCTNCRLDDIDCTLCEKRRYPKRNAHRATRPDIRGSPSSAHLDTIRDSYQADEVTSRHSPTNNTEQDGELEGSSIHVSSLWNDEGFPIANRQPSNTTSIGTLAPCDTGHGSPSSSYAETLPSYLHCDLSHLSDEKLSHLAANGCFTVPDKSVVDDLLKSYFDFIHPHLPVLDEQEFWERYWAQNRDRLRFYPSDSRSIGLLLFQAVLFAATTCVSPSVLHKAGYSSRKVARRAAFSKVHALYSLGVENDKTVVLQSLLLMSYWRDDSNDYEDAWHWSGLAVTLAYSLGLQGNASTTMSERQKALRKRCWWSCVLRDRLVALSEQRPQRIRLEECDMPMLTLADYNVGLRSRMSKLSPGEELGKRTALSLFSIQLIRLVLCIGNDSSCTRDEDMSSPTTAETWTRTQPITSEDSFRTGIAHLDSWKLNLPEVLQHPPECVGDDAVLPCILVHRTALHIYYHKVILSICTPRLLSPTSPSELNLDSELVHQSSLILSRLYDELIDCDLIHCLSSDCLRSLTRIGQAKMGQIHLAKIYTSILGRPGGLRHDSTRTMTASKRDLSDPTATENLAQFDLQPFQNENLTNEMNMGESDQMLRGHDLGDLGLKNMPDYVSDGSWIFDDTESSGVTSFNFPDLSADGSSIITSEVEAVESSTLLNLEALLSTSEEVVKS